MLKAKDLVTQSTDELDALLIEKRQALFHLRNEFVRNKKLEKPHMLRQLRREIARLLTVQHAKKTAQREAME